eukprot:13256667-Alexandrium_andersonii.AAC.1
MPAQPAHAGPPIPVMQPPQPGQLASAHVQALPVHGQTSPLPAPQALAQQASALVPCQALQPQPTSAVDDNAA